MPFDFVCESPERQRRADRGLRAHLSGQAAEDAVARHYAARGLAVAARRWRGASGEVDLVVRDGATVVFVEVKSAATHAIAAEYFTRTQHERIVRTVADFIDGEPLGQQTDVRIDLALVDRGGRIEITENLWLD
ncbi:YraN family protein [Rhodobacter sp. Har01]|uniref:YraN family protein n=1 Tax=Rhodobacter sp. Har01 TaxID=2883999 RepID=UPI001D06AE41|nr:YraN family protein [Rhodobacter sp. Har01]MCB6179009.1 YraN family protein [Rhodobacter sp. Har01]